MFFDPLIRLILFPFLCTRSSQLSDKSFEKGKKCCSFICWVDVIMNELSSAHLLGEYQLLRDISVQTASSYLHTLQWVEVFFRRERILKFCVFVNPPYYSADSCKSKDAFQFGIIRNSYSFVSVLLSCRGILVFLSMCGTFDPTAKLQLYLTPYPLNMCCEAADD